MQTVLAATAGAAILTACIALACGEKASEPGTVPNDAGNYVPPPSVSVLCAMKSTASPACADVASETILGAAIDGGDAASPGEDAGDAGVNEDASTETEPAGPARCPVDKAFELSCAQGERAFSGNVGFGTDDSAALIAAPDSKYHRVTADGTAAVLPRPSIPTFYDRPIPFGAKGGVAVAGHAIADGRAGVLVNRADGTTIVLDRSDESRIGRFATAPSGTSYGLVFNTSQSLFWTGEELADGGLSPSDVQAFAVGPGDRLTLVRTSSAGSFVDDRPSPIAFELATPARPFLASLAVGAHGPVVAYAFQQGLVGGYFPDGRRWIASVGGKSIGCDPGPTSTCNGSCEGEGAAIPEDEIALVADAKGRVWAFWLETTYRGTLVQTKSSPGILCQIFGCGGGGCYTDSAPSQILRTELVIARVHAETASVVPRSRISVPTASETKLRSPSARRSGVVDKLLRAERVGARIAVSVSGETDGKTAIMFLDPEAMP
jgi:hypothetical protein